MIEPKDLKPNAGKWIDAELPGLSDALAPDTPLLLGGLMPAPAEGVIAYCFRCKGETALSVKDMTVMRENPGLQVMCPYCFFELQAASK